MSRSSEAQIDEPARQFLSPKRKRIMSPVCFKNSLDDMKDTHIPKHRETCAADTITVEEKARLQSNLRKDGQSAAMYGPGLVSDIGSGQQRAGDASSEFGEKPNDSPGTSSFLRRPNIKFAAANAEQDQRFGSLRKGNIFDKDDSFSNYSTEDELDADGDADESTDRPIHMQGMWDFRQFRQRGSPTDKRRDQRAREGDGDADPGAESDFSCVAGRMSSLSVGKRSGRASKLASQPCSPSSSQNSSVNSHGLPSPGRHVFSALHSHPDSPSAAPRRLTRAGYPSAAIPQPLRAYSTSGGPSARANASFPSPERDLQQDMFLSSSAAKLSNHRRRNSSSTCSAGGSANKTYVGAFTSASDMGFNHSDTDLMYSSNQSVRSDFPQQSPYARDVPGTVMKTRPAASASKPSPPSSASASMLQAMRSGLFPAAGSAGRSKNIHRGLDAGTGMWLAEQATGQPHSSPTSVNLSGAHRPQYDSCGSPIISDKGAHQSQHAHEAMGDLGTPVTEVGSPAVLDDLEDLDAEEEEGGEGGMGVGDSYGQSSFFDEGEELDDAEVVMISSQHQQGRGQGQGQERKSSERKGGAQQHYFGLGEASFDEHSYHLFAQKFMESPSHGATLSARLSSPMPLHPLNPAMAGSFSSRGSPVPCASSGMRAPSVSELENDPPIVNMTDGTSIILTKGGSLNCSSEELTTETSTTTNTADRPLPDQSAFDGSSGIDMSHSSYGPAGTSALDPMLASVGSARKKRPTQLYSVSPTCPPTPLRGMNWSSTSPNVGAPLFPNSAGGSGDRQEGEHEHRHAHEQIHGYGHLGGVDRNGGAGEAFGGVLGGASVAHSGEGDFCMALPDTEKSPSEDTAFPHKGQRMFGGVHGMQMHMGKDMGAVPILRQSSLMDSKLLLTACSDDMLSISFHEDFKEEGLLGSGTFADVFKVRMRSGQDQNSFFAVKKSKRQFRSKRDRDWLMEEVRTMKMLGQAPCPYVVPFIRAWQEESYFYVQMGYAERGTLKELLLHLASPRKKRPLGVPPVDEAEASRSSSGASDRALVSDETVWHIVHDVAAGLQHVHACGYVHLDIKPANLLVTGQGTVQIGDFGMAAVIGSREDGHEGDTRYMADELLNNTERLPSADIFSLGLTLFEICCFYPDETTPTQNSQHSQQSQGSSGGGMRVTPRRSLPTDGTLWHTLREGRAPPLPAHRSPALCALVAAAMRPVPAARPAALDLLSAPEAQACSEEVDPTLLSAPNPADQRMPYLSRSVSMQQHSGLAGFVAAGGAGGGTSSKAPTLTLDTDIDYSAIGESVFTPHYTPR